MQLLGKVGGKVWIPGDIFHAVVPSFGFATVSEKTLCFFRYLVLVFRYSIFISKTACYLPHTINSHMLLISSAKQGAEFLGVLTLQSRCLLFLFSMLDKNNGLYFIFFLLVFLSSKSLVWIKIWVKKRYECIGKDNHVYQIQTYLSIRELLNFQCLFHDKQKIALIMQRNKVSS